MNKLNPAITVLMPAYNAERFIGEAIDSVLKQTFRNFEFIIINDGSTDNTEAIINSFDDIRIRLISQDNKGIAGALNLGLAAAKSDIVARFDADDICYPDRLEKQYNFLLGNPEFVIAGGAADYIDQENQHIFTWTPPLSDADIRKTYLKHCPFIHAGVMYRKSAVIAAGGYNPHAHSFEDHFLWVKLLEKKGFAMNLHEPVLKVRLNPGSVTIDEKWRGRKFRNIKYRSLKQARITENDGHALKKILETQDTSPIKEGAYHAMLGKKYLWNNYQPQLARESIRKAISRRPFHISGYGLFAMTFLSQSMISLIYKTLKTN